MVKNKSVIIVGAGASKEVGLPTGAELKGEIAQLLDIRLRNGYERISGDDEIYEAYRTYQVQKQGAQQDINPMLHASWRIRDSMPLAISIDNFIDAHREDKNIALCGKLAIVRSILQAESNSALYIDLRDGRAKLDYSSIANTWLSSFWQIVTENCQKEDLAERFKNITFIVFNYDRCIEQFLYHSLQTFYGFDQDESAEMVNSINIYHPYGVVGCLPWQQGDVSINFGGELHPQLLLQLADQIKTFTEGTDPQSSEIMAIKRSVLNADLMLFLGFAFHRLNMDLIKPEEDAGDGPGEVAYFGTAVSISDSDCDILVDEIEGISHSASANIELRNDLKCSEIFNEYWRSLALY